MVIVHGVESREKQRLVTRSRLVGRIKKVTAASVVALLAGSYFVLVAKGYSALAHAPREVNRADGVLQLPEKPTRELIALGDSIFHGPASPGTCAVCHGPRGKGSRFGPSLMRSPRAFAGDGSMESIANVIRGGIGYPPAMLPSMPSYEGLLDREEIWALAAYVYTISNRGK